MKRMILVPEDVYAIFEQKQNLETSPIMKNMINTDTDMTDILQRTLMLMIQKSKNCIMPTWKDTLISDNRKAVKHQSFR